MLLSFSGHLGRNSEEVDPLTGMGQKKNQAVRWGTDKYCTTDWETRVNCKEFVFNKNVIKKYF